MMPPIIIPLLSLYHYLVPILSSILINISTIIMTIGGDINNRVERTVRFERTTHRRIRVRVPFILLFWAFLFHSESLHPILQNPTSKAVQEWFGEQYPSISTEYSSRGRGDSIQPSSFLQRMITTNPYAAVKKHPLRY